MEIFCARYLDRIVQSRSKTFINQLLSSARCWCRLYFFTSAMRGEIFPAEYFIVFFSDNEYEESGIGEPSVRFFASCISLYIVGVTLVRGGMHSLAGNK